MKTNKIFAMFATVASIAALVSCQKEETFTLVQKNDISTITLTIEQPTDEDATKTHLGTASGTSYPIYWSANDSIAVGSQSGNRVYKYKLTEGTGTASGTFTGPTVDGAVYAYYPCNRVKSVGANTYTVNIPAQQKYVANSFGEGALPMYGVASSTSDLHTLIPLMSVLKIPLKGTCKVSRIVVSSTSQKLSGTGTVTFSGTAASMTVTGNDYVELVCSTAVQLNENTANLFHIAIPAVTSGLYTVRVITDESKVLTKTLTISSAFEAGKMKKTAELTDVAPTTVQYVEGSYCGTPTSITTGSAPSQTTTVWAPVNCGYDATNYKYGKLYQWGRAVGGGYVQSGAAYNDAGGVYQTYVITMQGTTETNPRDESFYDSEPLAYDWYSTSNHLSAWPMKSGDAGYVEGKIANPCPAGWRVPTYDELNALKGGYIRDKNSGDLPIKDEIPGLYLNGTDSPAQDGTANNSIFLHAAGFRSRDGSANQRGKYGSYWALSVDGDKAKKLVFQSDYVNVSKSYRAYGGSVRCVMD